MRTAVFHGSLAKKFGKEHRFDAPTLYLLTQGLILQLGDVFKETIRDGSWTIVPGKPDRKKSNAFEEAQVHQQLGKTEVIHFYPAVKGESGAVRVILGLAIVAVAYAFFGGNPLMVKVGAAIALGGVASMLAAKPKSSQSTQGTDAPNYFFTTGVNTDDQGGPVPIIYGRVQRAGSLVISKGVDTGQITN